jgi:hypothetical protein
MLSMIANPVTALPVGYPRSGLSRSDLVPWHNASVAAAQRHVGNHCRGDKGQSAQDRGLRSD